MIEVRHLERVIAGCIAIFALGCAGQRGAASRLPQSMPTPGPGKLSTDAPEVDKAQTLSSRVTKVTVYSDRARVTRTASAKLSAQPTVFAFRKLPGWVDDGSVRVSLSAGRIVDVRAERHFLARATDRSWRRAQAKHQALTRRLAALNDEITILNAQKKQIEGIMAISLQKIGEIKIESYRQVLAFISSALRTTAKARRAVQQQRDTITPEYQASQKNLAEMRNLMKLEQTTVLVTVQGPSKAPTTVRLTYMIPGVTWQPVHDLRVSAADSSNAEVVSFAVVTQTSGEDWKNAELSFSTQSSVRSMRIPQLESLTLGDTRTATHVLKSKMSSFVRAQNAFRQQGQLWNKVNRPWSARQRLSFDRVYKQNIQSLRVVQNKTVRIFQRLWKRGTTAHFKASAAMSVRGDGHPVRLRIGHGTLAAKHKTLAVPEQSLNAAQTLEMVNGTGQPLLPGKVALYQDGAFLGMTDMAFVADAEKFSLFVSVADHLKLSRKLDRKHSALVRKRRNKMQVAFIVTVENLSSRETVLTLVDRIPVSENKGIHIDRVRISDAKRPDSRGLLRWKLLLQPKEKRQLRIAYQVEYPAELVLQTRRRRAAMARRSARGLLPRVAPSQVLRRKYRIEDQLSKLEALF